MHIMRKSKSKQAVEKLPFIFESLRANGGAVEMIEYFPFVLSFVEALLSFSIAYRDPILLRCLVCALRC